MLILDSSPPPKGAPLKSSMHKGGRDPGEAGPSPNLAFIATGRFQSASLGEEAMN
jgi:hypothetical protein